MLAPKQPDRASACEWARAALLSATLAWTTLCLGGVLPETKVITAVLVAALVAVHFGDPKAACRAHPAGWLPLPFIAYAATNAAWVTPFHWIGWADWQNWAQAATVFWIALNGVRSVPCRALVASVLAALALACACMAAYQHFVNPTWIMLGRTQAGQFVGRSAGPFGIPNSLGVFAALLIPPAAAAAWGPSRGVWIRLAAALVTAALLLCFVLAISRGAWIALAGAVALKPLLSGGRSLAGRIAGTLAALAALAALAGTLYMTFPLMRVRVDQLVADAGEKTRPILWRGAWRIFEEHPAFGGGAGAFNTLFEKYRPLGYKDEPIYAHCDYLNTLADYGATGFVLLAAAVLVIGARASRARGLAGAAFTGLLAFGIHLLVDFHMKIPALALSVATIGAFVTAEAWAVPGDEGPRTDIAARGVSLAVAAAFLVLTLTWAVPSFRAEALRRGARAAIDKMGAAGANPRTRRPELETARAALEKAVRIDPENAEAWSDKAYAESLWALVEPGETTALGLGAERDAASALSLCPLVAEFWIRKGTGLDMQGHWLEGGDCTIQALRLAPGRADIWYYRAYHLSLNPVESGPAVAAADVCLRLDPGFLLAQVLRQRLEASP